jgi:hypothetical protein
MVNDGSEGFVGRRKSNSDLWKLVRALEYAWRRSGAFTFYR